MGRAKKESTREALLEAARVLFARKGLDATSVKDLVDYAGVNVSLVSYYFGGKEGLYQACLNRFGKAKLETIARVLQPPRSAEELRVRLGLFAEELVNTFIEEPELTKMIHRDIELENPAIEAVFRETFHKCFETLCAFLQAAQKQGFVRKGLEPRIMSASFVGSLVHFQRIDHLAKKFFGTTLKDAGYRERVKNQVLGIFLDGVCAEPRSD